MEHQLPGLGDVPVIEWSTAGGLRDPGGDAGVDLRVWSDGRVEVGERFAGQATEGSIEPDELQRLLAVAIEDHRFFELDVAAIDAALDAARHRRAGKASGGVEEIPLGPPFADAGTSRIAIAADGRRHEVRRDGLFAAARDHPEVEELGDLRAIEERLLSLAQQIATGRS